MDFLFTPEQDEAAALAAEILKDKATPERMKAVEAAGDRFDRELWATLGDAFDWSELDLIELARVLVEVGRAVAPVPLAVHAACVTFLERSGRPAVLVVDGDAELLVDALEQRGLLDERFRHATSSGRCL